MTFFIIFLFIYLVAGIVWTWRYMPPITYQDVLETIIVGGIIGLPFSIYREFGDFLDKTVFWKKK